MIRITTYSNTKCLKCLCVPEKLVRIGVYSMCNKCFIKEFEELIEDIEHGGAYYGKGIDPKGKGSKSYHHWLQIYLEKSEEEYFDTN